VDGDGGIAGGIAISTASSSGSVNADGISTVAVAAPVSNVNVTAGTETVRLRAGSEPEDAGGVDGAVAVVALGVGRVVASGGASWGADEAGELAVSAAADPHDQTHVQSQVHVSGVPVPACVENVVVLPQNVNVHVQFQGSAPAAVVEPAAEPEDSG
jgi:hypothetical protein